MRFSALLAATVLVLPLATYAQSQTVGISKNGISRTNVIRPVAAVKPADRATTARKSRRIRSSSRAQAANPAPSTAVALDGPLSDAQRALASRIYTGVIPCELGASVTVTADEKNPGFFTVSTGKYDYRMHPVESRTGAVRMEDQNAGGMWLQLGNKSMLLSQKLGQRLADECAAPAQREYALQMKNAPPVALFDAPTR